MTAARMPTKTIGGNNGKDDDGADGDRMTDDGKEA